MTAPAALDGLHLSLAQLSLGQATPPPSSSSCTSLSPTTAPTSIAAADGSTPDYTATPWMLDLQDSPFPKSTLELLDAELLAFHRWVKPTEEEHQFRRYVVDVFADVVRRLWPDATVQVFGSMATGLFLPTGDIDLCITSPSLLHRPPGIIFTTLARALTSHSIVPSSRSIEQVLGAKVPILKFQTSPSLGSFCVDVSLNSSNGPQGAEVCERLLRALGEGRRERAERLLLVWKTFLRSRDLGEVRDGGMGGMSAFMMVVHWFQSEHYFLPVSPSPSTDLLRFLAYFTSSCPPEAAFDHLTWCITPTAPNPLGYKSKAWTNPSFPDRLCIQHPVDPERDLTSGCYAFPLIKSAMRAALQDLVRFYALWDTPEEQASAIKAGPKGSALGGIGIQLSEGLLRQREGAREAWRAIRTARGEGDSEASPSKSVGKDRRPVDLPQPFDNSAAVFGNLDHIPFPAFRPRPPVPREGCASDELQAYEGALRKAVVENFELSKRNEEWVTEAREEFRKAEQTRNEEEKRKKEAAAAVVMEQRSPPSTRPLTLPTLTSPTRPRDPPRPTTSSFVHSPPPAPSHQPRFQQPQPAPNRAPQYHPPSTSTPFDSPPPPRSTWCSTPALSPSPHIALPPPASSHSWPAPSQSARQTTWYHQNTHQQQQHQPQWSGVGLNFDEEPRRW